jgi:Fe-S oxidoreductase
LDAMDDHIARGTPVVVLEPSCCSVFRDEMRGLLPESPRANMLRENIFLLLELLEKKASSYSLPTLKRRAIVQGHCHHKALMRMTDELSVMKKMGIDAEVLQSGCCGMAGSFGFEKEKYDVSVQCGERSLLPAVRKTAASDIIIADGFSCREQIAQGTQRHALHLAEVLEMAMREGPDARREPYPENRVVRARQLKVRRSMWRAAASLAGIAVVTFAFWRRINLKR